MDLAAKIVAHSLVWTGIGILLMVLIPIGTLFGAITGLIVGWFFGDTILHTLAQIGIRDVTMWQIGATLGFVGAFFKSTTSSSKD